MFFSSVQSTSLGSFPSQLLVIEPILAVLFGIIQVSLNLKLHPDWSPLGVNSNFVTSILDLFIWVFPPRGACYDGNLSSTDTIPTGPSSLFYNGVC